MRQPIHSPITLFAASDRGLVREKNEDAYIAMTVKEPDENPFAIRALLAVADGMGGHVGGELASRAAVRLLDDIFSKHGGGGLWDFPDIESAVMAIITIVIAIGVILATLFVKQHYIADEISGFALAYVISRLIFDRQWKKTLVEQQPMPSK